MRIFGKENKKKNDGIPVMQTASRENSHPFLDINRYTPLTNSEYSLYSSLREAVPIVDAALDKIVRLVGEFRIKCINKNVEQQMNDFIQVVKSGGCNKGMATFFSVYLNQLLTFGTAVGEIVLSGDGREIYSLVNVPLRKIELTYAENKIDTLVCLSGADSKKKDTALSGAAACFNAKSRTGQLEGDFIAERTAFCKRYSA